MSRNFLLLGCLVLGFALSAQNENCKPKDLHQINAASGMKMRKGPGVGNPVVSYIPSKAIVVACAETSKKDKIENIDGHWRKVVYQNQSGYVFDGFLDPLHGLPADSLESAIKTFEPDTVRQKQLMAYIPKGKNLQAETIEMDVALTDEIETEKVDTPKSVQPKKPVEQPPPPLPPAKKAEYQFVTETYNYCGAIEQLDPGMLWYGIYQEGDEFHFREVELQILKSKYSLGKGLEFDVRTNNAIPSTFLLGINMPLDTNRVVNFPQEFFNRNPRQLYPGQRLEIYPYKPGVNRNNFILSAVGSVTEVGYCPTMKDYKIRVAGEVNNIFLYQDLTKDFSELGKCGIPEIYWFGDVNDDQFPDVIFASKYDDYTVFTLFITDESQNKKLLMKVGEWRVGECD